MEMPVTDGVACDATEVTWGDGSSIPSGEECSSRGWDSEGTLEGEERAHLGGIGACSEGENDGEEKGGDGRHGCKLWTVREMTGWH